MARFPEPLAPIFQAMAGARIAPFAKSAVIPGPSVAFEGSCRPLDPSPRARAASREPESSPREPAPVALGRRPGPHVGPLDAPEGRRALGLARAWGYVVPAAFEPADQLADRVLAMIWRLTHPRR